MQSSKTRSEPPSCRTCRRLRVPYPGYRGGGRRQGTVSAAETKEGGKRTAYELEVGPSLRNATARVAQVTRAGSGPGKSVTAGTAGGSAERTKIIYFDARV